MMFDPPDFPYKDLNETMKVQFGSTALFNTPTEVLQNGDEEYDNNESSELLLLDKSGALPENNANTFNTELFIIQADNIFTNEPALLDENTVNQFLLPTEPNSETDVNEQPKGPDLLALHSCTICHEIFMNDNDMVEHSIINHSDEKVLCESFNNFIGREDLSNLQTTELIVYSNGTDIDVPKQVADSWLVCGVCQRILSTASETDSIDQLCCRDESGKSRSIIQALDTMYLCEVCNALYADSDSLELHRIGCINQQNKENISMEDSVAQISNPKEINFCFSCDVCGMQNESIEQLKSHSLVCSPATIPKERRPKNNAGSNKMWNCGSCNQLFATARDLYRHKRGEDRPEGAPLTAFVCDACDKVLGSMCALHTHKKMHRVTKPGFACRVCGRRFNQSGHLAIHMRMHTGERPYPCDLCPKAFKVKVERDDHRRTHTGERPFSCAACPKTFTAAARLREHARIHTDQRPYRCDICGAAFRRPYARTVHTLIHTGAKPHECDVCGTAFRRSGDMWKHKRNLHGDA